MKRFDRSISAKNTTADGERRERRRDRGGHHAR